MENQTQILSGKAEITVGGETITVRELKWSETMELFKKLSAHLGKAFQFDAAGKVKTNLDLQKVVELITSTDELLGWIVKKTTDREFTWFGNLSNTDATALLNTISELNLNEQLRKNVEALGRQFAGLLPSAKPVSAKLTPG